MFIDHLKRLGLYHESDDKGGGGSPTGRSLEEMTNAKISGTLADEDEGGETANPKTPSDAPKDSPKPDSPVTIDEPDEEAEEPEPADKPEPKDEDEPEPVEAKEKSDDAGDDDPDPDESEQPAFYYDPERDVEGKPAHTNKFKTKENAEYAAVQKTALLKETLEKLDQAGVDRGAIPLPKALKGSLDSLDNLTNLETVVNLPDEDLKGFLDESDRFRQRLESKMERKQGEQQARQVKNEFEGLQKKVFDNLQNLMSIEDMQASQDKLGDIDSATKLVNSKIDEKISDELKSDRKELEEWIDKVDEGEISLSHKEFDKQKDRRIRDIQTKEKELRGEYTSLVDDLKDLHQMANQVDQHTELTPQQKMENLKESFFEWQKDRSDDLYLMEDTSEARAELVSMKNWAIQNKADYNDLQHPADWNRATEGWNEFKTKLRADRQKKELNGTPPKNKKPDEDDSDVPKPGDQSTIRDKNAKSVEDVRRKSMDKLVELTNATVGA